MSKEHCKFMEEYLDNKPLSTLREVHMVLHQKFPDLQVSLATVYNYVTNMCEYTIKRIRKVSDKRNDPAVLTARE
ncbi:hypothetical protein BGX27_006327, partial [Mortierella sp. AM989]